MGNGECLDDCDSGSAGTGCEEKCRMWSMRNVSRSLLIDGWNVRLKHAHFNLWAAMGLSGLLAVGCFLFYRMKKYELYSKKQEFVKCEAIVCSVIAGELSAVERDVLAFGAAREVPGKRWTSS